MGTVDLLGSALRQLRESRHMMTDEVSALAGVDPTTIRRWERGQVQVPKLDAYLALLGVQPMTFWIWVGTLARVSRLDICETCGGSLHNEAPEMNRCNCEAAHGRGPEDL